MPKGKNAKLRNRQQKQEGQSTLDAIESIDKISTALTPAKGPSDGKIHYDKDTDELTIKQASGDDIKIRPEKAIEPDTLPVKEGDFFESCGKLNILSVYDLSNPMQELQRSLREENKGTHDLAKTTCSALVTPLHWRKFGKRSWRCSLISLLEGDLFSDIVVKSISNHRIVFEKARLIMAINGHAVCESNGVGSKSIMCPSPMLIPRFSLLSCNIELVLDNVQNPELLSNQSFLIDYDTYMMSEELKKKWSKRLDAQLFFESIITTFDEDGNPSDRKREYVVDISYGNVKRVIVGNRSNFEKVNEVEESKRLKQLELLKKAREENRPNFPDPKFL